MFFWFGCVLHVLRNVSSLMLLIDRPAAASANPSKTADADDFRLF